MIRKFSDGDRVNVDGYVSVMIVVGIDEFLTGATGKLHYLLSSEDCILGKARVNTGEPCSEDELSHCTE